MVDMNWREIRANFGGANQAMAGASQSMSQAGNIFGRMREQQMADQQATEQMAFRQRALDEQTRQFGVTSGLDREKFEELQKQFGVTSSLAERQAVEEATGRWTGAGGTPTGGFTYAGPGSLAAKYESGAKGSGAIGYDSGGGTSFGKYQIASKPGTFNDFTSWLENTGRGDVATRLRSAGPSDTGSTSGASVDAWLNEVNAGNITPELEHQFINDSHFQPAVNALSSDSLKQMVNNSLALQEVLWSSAVQHGAKGGSDIFNAVYREGMSEEDLINAAYNKRSSEYGKTQGISERMNNERNDALSMIGAQPTGQAGTISLRGQRQAQETRKFEQGMQETNYDFAQKVQANDRAEFNRDAIMDMSRLLTTSGEVVQNDDGTVKSLGYMTSEEELNNEIEGIRSRLKEATTDKDKTLLQRQLSMYNMIKHTRENAKSATEIEDALRLMQFNVTGGMAETPFTKMSETEQARVAQRNELELKQDADWQKRFGEIMSSFPSGYFEGIPQGVLYKANSYAMANGIDRNLFLTILDGLPRDRNRVASDFKNMINTYVDSLGSRGDLAGILSSMQMTSQRQKTTDGSTSLPQALPLTKENLDKYNITKADIDERTKLLQRAEATGRGGRGRGMVAIPPPNYQRQNLDELRTKAMENLLYERASKEVERLAKEQQKTLVSTGSNIYSTL